MSRQGYYKSRHARQRRQVDEEAVVKLVQLERAAQPKLGTRKLLVRLRPELKTAGLAMGRDRLFGLLRDRGMLIQRRRRTARTTDSRHGFRVHPNRYRAMALQGPHEAWLSDLTYVRTQEGFVYLWLIHDAWSRRIVGYALKETLEVGGSLQALDMALRELPGGAQPVHHSDRGIQYCCAEYARRLERHRIGVSMTELDHCYENAQAERLNGILKQEYGLGQTLRSKALALAAVREAVTLYNTRRPHTSLGYRTPEHVHRQYRPASSAATPVALRAPSVAADQLQISNT